MGTHVAVLNSVVRINVMEEVKFEQTLEGGEGIGHKLLEEECSRPSLSVRAAWHVPKTRREPAWLGKGRGKGRSGETHHGFCSN